MKLVRKILLLISIILFLLTLVLTAMTAFCDYYIFIGNLGTSKLLTILAGVAIVFLSLFIITDTKPKKIITISSVLLLILSEVIMIAITFLPKYQYIHHPSGPYAVMVEEKTSHEQISITFSKNISGIFYKHMYAVTFTGKKKDNYISGDYSLAYNEKYARINIPSNNTTAILIPH